MDDEGLAWGGFDGAEALPVLLPEEDCEPVRLVAYRRLLEWLTARPHDN